MDSQSYLTEKQNFYANLQGTTVNEVINLIFSFSLVNFCSTALKILLLSWTPKIASQFWTSFLVDFVFNFIPLILICTILSDWVHLFQACLTAVAFLLYLGLSNCKLVLSARKPKSPILINLISLDRQVIKLAISTFRTWVYLLTSVSILAVDFHIFPRRLAKTETYGVSLMDLGVGFFIVCHAMKFIRSNHFAKMPLLMRLLKELKHSSILIALGILRLISVKLTGYVEHESEYGRHWNFFFTIVVVKLSACLLERLTDQSSLKTFLIGSVIAGFYQIALTKNGLSGHLLSRVRNEQSLIDLNREGIASCVGYLAIYMMAQAVFLRIQAFITKQEEIKDQEDFKSSLRCLVFLGVVSFLFWIAFELSRNRVENVSRRLCNLSFILLNITLSALLLGLFLITILVVVKFTKKNVMEGLKKEDGDKKIVQGEFIGMINFFLSNILTGCINLSINTLAVSNILAFVIICAYSWACFAISMGFYKAFNK